MPAQNPPDPARLCRTGSAKKTALRSLAGTAKVQTRVERTGMVHRQTCGAPLPSGSAVVRDTLCPPECYILTPANSRRSTHDTEAV